MPPDRTALWTDFIRRHEIRSVAEIGVWKGEFAEAILRNCPAVNRYYMLDPWRPLPNWNKPFNVIAEEFAAVFAEACTRTDFAGNRRVILRGTTSEVIDEIDDGSLDLAYIDGDHTLRGISIDLITAYPKVKLGGFIAGDDFFPCIWHHPPKFEPSLVFPFAVHFAEAKGLPLRALPHNQFLITNKRQGFQFCDPENRYANHDLSSQIAARPHTGWRRAFAKPLKRARRVMRPWRSR